jgi:hypothetical protein
MKRGWKELKAALSSMETAKIVNHHHALNGTLVTILHKLDAINRYIVLLPSGIELALPPSALISSSENLPPSIQPTEDSPAGIPIKPAKRAYKKRAVKADTAVPGVPQEKTILDVAPASLPPVESRGSVSIRVKSEFTNSPPTAIDYEEIGDALIASVQKVEKVPAAPFVLERSRTTKRILEWKENVKMDISNYSALVQGLNALSSVEIEGAVSAIRCFEKYPDNPWFLYADGPHPGRDRALIVLIHILKKQLDLKVLWLSGSEMLECVQIHLNKDATDLNTPIQFDIPDGSSTLTNNALLYSYRNLIGPLAKKKVVDQMMEWFSSGDEWNRLVILDDLDKLRQISNGQLSLEKLIGSKARVIYCSSSVFLNPSEIGGAIRIVGELAKGNGQSKDFLPKLAEMGKCIARFPDLFDLAIETLSANVPEDFKILYDNSYLIWAELWKAMISPGYVAEGDQYCDSEDDVGSKGKSASSGSAYMIRQFWNAHQTYFKNLILSVKVSTIQQILEKSQQPSNVMIVVQPLNLEFRQQTSFRDCLMRIVRKVYPNLANDPRLSEKGFSGIKARRKPLRRKTRLEKKLDSYDPTFLNQVVVDDFGTRQLEYSESSRFVISQNSNSDSVPRRVFKEVETKKVSYTVQPRLPKANKIDCLPEEDIEPTAVSTDEGEDDKTRDYSGSHLFDLLKNILKTLPNNMGIEAILGGHQVEQPSKPGRKKAQVGNKLNKISVVSDIQQKPADILIFAELPLSGYKGFLQILSSMPKQCYLIESPMGGDSLMAGSILNLVNIFKLSDIPLLPDFPFESTKAKLAIELLGRPALVRQRMPRFELDTDTSAKLQQIFDYLGWNSGEKRIDATSYRFLQRLYGLPVNLHASIFRYIAYLLKI